MKRVPTVLPHADNLRVLFFRHTRTPQNNGGYAEAQYRPHYQNDCPPDRQPSRKRALICIDGYRNDVLQLFSLNNMGL